MKILIVVEETETGYSAYSPDIDGCVATGETRPGVETTMRDAISLHLEQLRADGQSLDVPHSYATYVEIAA